MNDASGIAERIRSGTAVVTGAGSGLGRALALKLAGEGMRVAGLGRRDAPLHAVAEAASGGRFHPFAVDIGQQEALTAVFARIRDEIGPVTLLINNAAVYPHRDILDETPESFMQTVGINLAGTFNCCHAVLPGMVEEGYGRIVNVGSFAGERPAPAAAAYSVSKGAARILTRALVADLGDRFPDIVINEWMPGVLNTEMGLADGLDPEAAAVWGANLALRHDRGLSGAVFEQDREILPPVSLKRRLFNKLTGQARAARNLRG